MLLGTILLAGCAVPAKISPRYAELKPSAVAVLPVANETVLPLREVKFGGALQRVTTGPRVYDIPAILRTDLLSGLSDLGYEAMVIERSAAPSAGAPDGGVRDFTKPLPEGTAELPFDAALYSRVTYWDSSSSGAWKASIRCAVELYSVPGGELLYSVEIGSSHTTDSRTKGTDEIGGFLHRCARKLLSRLPQAEG